METMTLSACDELRAFLIEQLRRDASCHEQGYFGAIGEGVARLPRLEGFSPEDEDELLRLMVLEDFWACWIDARNENWTPALCVGIAQDEWPILARRLCDAVDAGASAARLQTIARVYDLSTLP